MPVTAVQDYIWHKALLRNSVGEKLSLYILLAGGHFQAPEEYRSYSSCKEPKWSAAKLRYRVDMIIARGRFLSHNKRARTSVGINFPGWSLSNTHRWKPCLSFDILKCRQLSKWIVLKIKSDMQSINGSGITQPIDTSRDIADLCIFLK